MRITKAGLRDLEDYNVFSLYQKDVGKLFMVHGEMDSTAPPEDATRFAESSGAEIVMIPNAEHRLMGPGEMERVLSHAVAFYGKE